jgi:trimeric autotransporter adhesin
MKKYLLVHCIFCLTYAISFAQLPTLIKNINPITTDVSSSSFPKKGVVCNGNYYFPATDYNGNELWKTNGISFATSLIKDINSVFENSPSNPNLFTIFGNSFYFFTGTDININKYNTSTNQFSNVFAYPGVRPTEAVKQGDNIFFAGDAYFGNGIELLRFNTITNSLSIYDINVGVNNSNPKNLMVKGDTIYFAANNGINGNELWMFDVVSDNVSMVKDINVGAASSNPHDFLLQNDILFFSAANGINGVELWTSDGDAAGTDMFADINGLNSGADSSNPNHKILFNNKVYFSASNGITGVELWVADYNSLSFSLISDINPTGNSNPAKFGFKQAGSFLYFDADDGSVGDELWVTDGTGAGTQLVEDINPSGNSTPMDMYNLNDTLIFTAYDGGATGWQIYRSKSTNGSTNIIQNIQPPSADTIRISGVYNGYVYFGADNGTIGEELWKTKGLSANTSLVKDINAGSGINSDVYWMEPYNSFMYFVARKDDSYQWGLHRTDGTTAATTEVKAPDANFAMTFEQGKKAGSWLYFTAYTTATGNELWKSDGTNANTVLVKDIAAGAASSDPGNFIEMGTQLIFSVDDGVNGPELWKSNGTTAGTVLVKNIRVGSTGSNINTMRLLNNKIIFLADDGINGQELWITDGTTAGTILLKNINNNATATNITDMFVIGTKMYFTADDGIVGSEMWVTDGTAAGTVLFKDINPGAASSNPQYYTKLGNFVYFAATNNSSNPSKIWRTDETLNTANQFYNVDYPFYFTNVNNKIVFLAFPAGSSNGFRLWSTDGTTGGTLEIKDFLPGGVNYFIFDNYPVHNGKWFLWLDDNTGSGQELWATTGTTAGTQMYDIAPGPHSSYPQRAKGLNPLIFTANDGSTNGRELWKLDVTVLPTTGLQFTVEKKNKTAVLDFKTYTEQNNKGFEIQRSNDGVHFDSLDFVFAKPNASNGAAYSFTDANPFDGKNYYRLKQIDVDGKFFYSSLRWINFDKERYVTAWPNPTTNLINISTNYNFKNAIAKIIAANGQMVKQLIVKGNGNISLPVADLPAGVYHVQIKENGKLINLVFVKQ